MEKLHLVPVIHLENGSAVINNQITGEKLFTDPVDLAVELDELGFDELLLVDDSGEKDGVFTAYDLAYEIAGYTSIEIIAKGGLRTFESVAKVYETGIARAMLSSLPILDPETMVQLIDAFGSNSLLVNIDLLDDSVVYKNKTEISEMPIEQIIELYSSMGIDRFSIHSYGENNTKMSPDLSFFEKVSYTYPRNRIYAGEGIDTADDFLAFENAGLTGMYLGDEFYTNADLFKGMKKYVFD